MLSVKIDMRVVEALRESFSMFKRDKTEYKPGNRRLERFP
jgi:hypothetical protein